MPRRTPNAGSNPNTERRAGGGPKSGALWSYPWGAVLAVALCLTSAATGRAQPLVVLDAGHGGRDPGAVGCGRNEAPNVLNVVERMAPVLRAAGLRVALTRENDTFVELQARAAFANSRDAALFVSVHANANAGAPASGSETWIGNNASATSRNLANRLQAALIAAWGLRDRGVKSANFTVLTATSMPAALTEIGFINHCDVDSVKIGDPNQRQRIAETQAGAIAAQLGVNVPDSGARSRSHAWHRACCAASPSKTPVRASTIPPCAWAGWTCGWAARRSAPRRAPAPGSSSWPPATTT